MSKNTQAAIWSVVMIALGAFGQELAAGHIALPATWAWIVPVLMAAINALSPNVRLKKTN